METMGLLAICGSLLLSEEVPDTVVTLNFTLVAPPEDRLLGATVLVCGSLVQETEQPCGSVASRACGTTPSVGTESPGRTEFAIDTARSVAVSADWQAAESHEPTPEPVPEPGSMLLLAIGALALFAVLSVKPRR
jgi:hypothetical protein